MAGKGKDKPDNVPAEGKWNSREVFFARTPGSLSAGPFDTYDEAREAGGAFLETSPYFWVVKAFVSDE